ncbi:hypothetical protein G5714_018012 [Onychostoma macrolepis]|uniref:Uncharacterized protein n=1 Tax=Onychostoma macrolepis TaxID=369639 RepID=A0A7J6C2W2_9TELE|nr:hypothetical protein G5714_018012 [Onychostoma macrolepis]
MDLLIVPLLIQQRNRWAQCPLESLRCQSRDTSLISPRSAGAAAPQVCPANQPAFPRERPQELEQATRIQRRPRSIDGEQVFASPRGPGHG